MPIQTPSRWLMKDKKGLALTIRPLAQNDRSRLMAFFDSLSPSSKQTFQPHPFTPAFVAKMTRDAHASHHLRLVAISNKTKEMVGYVFITRPPLLAKIGYFGVAVSDKYQGRGISTLLIKTVLEYSRLHGVKTVYLNVMAHNERAQAAYQKYGFQLTAAPLLLSKYLTLYELWYNEALSELLHKPPTEPSHDAPPIWMKCQL